MTRTSLNRPAAAHDREGGQHRLWSLYRPHQGQELIAFPTNGWICNRTKRKLEIEAILTASDGTEHARVWAAFRALPQGRAGRPATPTWSGHPPHGDRARIRKLSGPALTGFRVAGAVVRIGPWYRAGRRCTLLRVPLNQCSKVNCEEPNEYSGDERCQSPRGGERCDPVFEE